MVSTYVSDLSKDFIINSGDRPDGMKSSGDFLNIDDWKVPEGFSTGLVERDFTTHPVGSLAGSVSADEFFSTQVPVYEPEYWPEIIEEKERKKNRLSDLRDFCGPNGGEILAYDQNGDGYCWGYSTAGCITLVRANMGLPYIRLSPHSLCARIMNGQDKGGWAGLSGSKAIDWGYSPVEYNGKIYWPEKSRNLKYDTEETREMSKNFRITEGFLDLSLKPYDMSLQFKQFVSCLLANIPCAMDFMWMGHSMTGMDVVRASNQYELTDMRSWGVRVWNSWKQSWGYRGSGVILGKKCVPDGGIAVRNVIAFG